MQKWWQDAVFYHIYPIGYLGAPAENNPDAETEHRILKVLDRSDEIKRLGCNAVYFGPVFESSSHGYDSICYEKIDRRLGDEASFRQLTEHFHENGIRVVLDGVFNHVGREFPPFLDLKARGPESPYVSWFKNVDFEGDNGYGDGFSYWGWEGNDALVSLNLQNPEVRSHIFRAVDWMIEKLNIDGLRLDVAYLLDRDFLDALSSHCRERNANFWLMGEIIHGDYRELACSGRLDSATNYECYKGLYSSHNDRNYFEIAWSMNRQSGAEGIYKDLLLYNFADNHDVDRIAAILTEKRHLFLVYVLLFTMPGIPSVYYGSEWMTEGRKSDGDRALRPSREDIAEKDSSLVEHIANLSLLRRLHTPLRRGDYRQLFVAEQQLVFRREYENHSVTIALNSSEQAADLRHVEEGLYLQPFDWKVIAR